MLDKLTVFAVGAAILVVVASASMALLRGHQMIGIEPELFYFNFEEHCAPLSCPITARWFDGGVDRPERFENP